MDVVSPEGGGSGGPWGLSIIAFVGSVFSPYYAWAGRTRPENHCAINIGLYGRGLTYWAMTERPEKAIGRTEDQFKIGPSSLVWDGSRLVIDFDEYTAPLPRRIKGRVTIHTGGPLGRTYQLTQAGNHRWTPYAPSARVDVALSHPDLSFSGYGYFDSNRGDEPLEDGVKTWTWARSHMPLKNGHAGQQAPDSCVLYDVVPRRAEEAPLRFGLRLAPDGSAERFDVPETERLSTSLWQMQRQVPADRAGTHPKILRTCEDSPFYTRSIARFSALGQDAIGMHESLNMDRFRSGLMKAVMPVRMPRQFW